MSIKSVALASAALFALSTGISVAQADEQDDDVRQLNIEQLEKARGQASTSTSVPAPAMKPEGQGGPELQNPPSPDEGMDDDNTADEPATSDDPKPAEDVPQGPEEEEEEEGAPPPK